MPEYDEPGAEAGWADLSGPLVLRNAPLWRRTLGTLYRRVRYRRSWKSATAGGDCGYPPGSPEFEAYQHIIDRSGSSGRESRE